MNTSVTRRDFLKTSGAVLAATALSASVSAEEAISPAKKRNIKKGIMWACIPGGGTVMDKFKMVRDAGFEGIEMDSGMNNEEVLKARDAAGLQIPTVLSALHWQRPLTDPSPKVRSDGLSSLEIALRDSKAYGASSVLLVPGIVKDGVSYQAAYERSQAEIKKAVPLAEQLGVKIGIENVWNHFLLSPLEAARYVDEFNSPAMAWHFDIGNVLFVGWPEHWIPVLGKRICKLHIKEYSRKKRDAEGLAKGFQVDYLQGDNNWPAIMRALDEIAYEGWGTAEPPYHPPGIAPADRLKQISQDLDKIYSM